MNQYTRGQKGKLSDMGLSDLFMIVLDMNTPGFSADISCFGLDAQGKLSDDRYMVFYNQKAAPQNAITYNQSGTRTTFNMALNALPASIDKVVFTASTDDGVMRKLGASQLLLGDALSFPFSGSDFQDEKALIIGELYRRDGVWRFGAVGQGFNGGLSALLKHFGGTEADAPAGNATPTPPPAPVPPPAPPAPPAPKPISLSKVTLEKRGDKISLEKRGGAGSNFGRIRVNLNWDQKAQTAAKPGLLGGLFGGGNKQSNIDLDLGCLFELADGRKSTIQALGDCWGNYEQPPYVHLDGDDRSGKVSSGENIFINGAQFDKIKRLLVYAFIYDGVPNWAATNGVVTIEAPNQPPIEVRLDNGGNQGMCAIALIENNDGNLQITKLSEYFEGRGQISAHQLMDERYNFGLKWVVGSKD